jgi:hypothetical protein
MNTKHTPGPWSRNIKPAAKYCTIFAGRNTHVAHVANGLPDEQIEANCNLIAAAPELLAALEQCCNVVGYRGDPAVLNQIVSQARAIIAKATGND